MTTPEPCTPDKETLTGALVKRLRVVTCPHDAVDVEHSCSHCIVVHIEPVIAARLAEVAAELDHWRNRARREAEQGDRADALALNAQDALEALARRQGGMGAAIEAAQEALTRAPQADARQSAIDHALRHRDSTPTTTRVAEHHDLRQRAEKAEAERDALQARIDRVRDLHRPIRVYDECEHDADHDCEPVEVYDYTGCTESIIGWACATCCYDDEHPLESCPHGADHRGVEQADSCPTRAALSEAEGDDRG